MSRWMVFSLVIAALVAGAASAPAQSDRTWRLGVGKIVREAVGIGLLTFMVMISTFNPSSVRRIATKTMKSRRTPGRERTGVAARERLKGALRDLDRRLNS
jgi:hypothetical protein